MADEFAAKKKTLTEQLDASHERLHAALAPLSHEQAMTGSEWSVIDCLNHLAPREGGYSRYVESLLSQERPAARRWDPERRWKRMLEFVDEEHQRCKEILAAGVPEAWDRPVEQLDGTMRALSTYIDTMVNHFEEHTNQILAEILPALAKT